MANDEAANPGLLRPPLIYVAFALAGLGAHALWPWSMSLGSVGRAAGVVVSLLGAALLLVTLKSFRAHKTPFPGTQPVRAIVDSGPFRISRNPAYLSFSLMLFGVALALQSYWLLVGLACAVTVVGAIVIPREERYLTENFGAAYTEYRSRVRRWI